MLFQTIVGVFYNFITFRFVFTIENNLYGKHNKKMSYLTTRIWGFWLYVLLSLHSPTGLTKMRSLQKFERRTVKELPKMPEQT